jgi:hypothetical protein
MIEMQNSKIDRDQMMNGKPFILVKLSISHEKEAEFNDFYQHVYIPKLMEVIPEIESVYRYEEYNIDGLLRFYHKQYWTLYETASEETARIALDAIHHRSGREKEKELWKKWQDHYFLSLQSSSIYLQRYVHPRQHGENYFSGRPFFCVSVETRKEKDETPFHDWYEKIYLPKNLADVPTWTACRRYSSLESSPPRHLTIYEAADEQGLQRSLELMRAPCRFGENASWTQWDTGNNSLITWEDATRFRPIFCYPF